ncbi:MAG TPA: NAD(P)-dependent oxidoreductase [bacterium]|nr:NAD(P)-dependent oxidoreductase [bacterium]
MKPRIFVTQPIPDVAVELMRAVADVEVWPRLDRHLSQDELVAAAKRNDYLFVMGGNLISADVIKANPNLKGIGMVHRRMPVENNVDLEAARAQNVKVVFPDPWEDVYQKICRATCDLAMAMILDLAYRVLEADRYTRAGKFKQEHTMALMGIGCSGKTLGSVGLGHVTRFMVPRARALEMRAVYTKRTRLPEAEERELGVEWVPNKDEVLKQSDFVSVGVDYNPSTHLMFGEREFALMKPTAYFINIGRGRIVDEQALIRALQNRTIAGAGLDVYWGEPPVVWEPAPSEEFFKMDNVILCPHNGGATWEARGELTKTCARNIIALINGERPRGLVTW